MPDLTRAEVEEWLAIENEKDDLDRTPCGDLRPILKSWLTLDARMRELEEAGNAFIKRYDELMPYVVNDRLVAEMHGVAWSHGNWELELQRIQQLCTSTEPKEKT